jgi:hypothetical protein
VCAWFLGRERRGERKNIEVANSWCSEVSLETEERLKKEHEGSYQAIESQEKVGSTMTMSCAVQCLW